MTFEYEGPYAVSEVHSVAARSFHSAPGSPLSHIYNHEQWMLVGRPQSIRNMIHQYPSGLPPLCSMNSDQGVFNTVPCHCTSSSYMYRYVQSQISTRSSLSNFTCEQATGRRKNVALVATHL